MFTFRAAHPILALSPMDGITDSPMRQITKKYGAPDLMTTEFVNVEGLQHAPERLLPTLDFQPHESPLLAQIYGLTPENFYQATLLICARGFSGVDLNFGCPARTVIHTGGGAALIKTPALAAKIFQATRQATLDYAAKHHLAPLPVSLKTRTGYERAQTREWLTFLLKLHPDLITLHARTLKQAYTGQADWSAIALTVSLRNTLSPATAIYGNGDLTCRAAALTAIHQTGADGATIARAALGNPWVFTTTQPPLQQKFAVALEHARLFEKTSSHRPHYSFSPMRKHLAAYITNFPGAPALRRALTQTTSAAEVAQIITPPIASLPLAY